MQQIQCHCACSLFLILLHILAFHKKNFIIICSGVALGSWTYKYRKYVKISINECLVSTNQKTEKNMAIWSDFKESVSASSDNNRNFYIVVLCFVLWVYFTLFFLCLGSTVVDYAKNIFVQNRQNLMESAKLLGCIPDS